MLHYFKIGHFADNNVQCSVHFVNDGVAINSSNVLLEFEGTGPSESVQVSEFQCRVDDGSFQTCKEIIMD